MGGITNSVTAFLHNARRAIDEVRLTLNDVTELEAGDQRLGSGLFRDGTVIVAPNEINDRHGTGVILRRCFGRMDEILAIRSSDLYGHPEFGEYSMRFAHRGRSRSESYMAICRSLEGNTFRYVVCVPYNSDELLTAIIIKDAFRAKLCVYVMDDNHLVTKGIPFDLMREALVKADLRLAISPEMRDGYESSFGLQFWLRPPVVTPQSISTEVSLPSDEVLDQRRGVVIGNLWSTQALKRLAQVVGEAQLKVDWYGNSKTAWLIYDINELAAKGVTAHGFLPEAELVEKLKHYAYALVPSGTLDANDERTDIAKYSLPTRLPFLLAVANMPTIVLGSPKTAAAGFVDRFGLGMVAPYQGRELRRAVETICRRDRQQVIREAATKLAPKFSAEGVGDWILASMDAGRPVTEEIEGLFPRRTSDYSTYIDPPAPGLVNPDFHCAYYALMRLKWRNYQPDFILDVGASTGVWAETAREVFRSARFVLVEPLRDLYFERYPYLAKKLAGFEIVSAAVADHPGEAEFQVSDDFYGSSLLNPADHRSYRTSKVRVTTLDEIMEESKLSGRGLLKLDIQFAEHLALAGGKRLLQLVDVVMVELSLQRLAPGAKTFSEMLDILRQSGFRYHDDVDLFRDSGDGTLLQKDVVFVREPLLKYRAAVD